MDESPCQGDGYVGCIRMQARLNVCRCICDLDDIPIITAATLQSLKNDARADTHPVLIKHRELTGCQTLILAGQLHNSSGTTGKLRLCPVSVCSGLQR